MVVLSKHLDNKSELLKLPDQGDKGQKTQGERRETISVLGSYSHNGVWVATPPVLFFFHISTRASNDEECAIALAELTAVIAQLKNGNEEVRIVREANLKCQLTSEVTHTGEHSGVTGIRGRVY